MNERLSTMVRLCNEFHSIGAMEKIRSENCFCYRCMESKDVSNMHNERRCIDCYREVANLSARQYRMKNKDNVSYRCRMRISGRIRAAIKRFNPISIKSCGTMDLVGCSLPFLVSHLKSLFQPGMSWDLLMSGEIHIDHIIPCAYFDLSTVGGQIACFHYSNLQPMWAKDNIRKSNNVISGHQMMLPLIVEFESGDIDG